MDELSSQKKNLTYIYIAHFTLGIIILIFNIYYYISKYWIYRSFKIIFLIGILIEFTFIAIPLVSLFFIFFRNNLIKSFNSKNKKISLVILILNILIGLILNIIFWMNFSKFPSFYKDCPYNYSFSEFNKLKEENEKHKSNENCQKRICLEYESKFINENLVILNNENNNHLNNYYINDNNNNNIYTNYLCSFDSSIDFLNDEVKCQKIAFTSKNTFLNFCIKYIFYYICQRIKPPSKFGINSIDGCPLENKITTIVDYFIILNLLFSFIPWIIELKFCDKYLYEIEREQNQIVNINNNNENQNEINVALGEAQIQNILNKTTNTSEAHLQRPNSQENINENINKSTKRNSQKNESEAQINYVFFGDELKSINDSKKEDEKEMIQKSDTLRIKNESNQNDENEEHVKQMFKFALSKKNNFNKDTNNNFENSSNNNKLIIEEIYQKKRNDTNGNLFYLKKENKIEENESNIIINKKKNRFFNNGKNKTLNFLGTNCYIRNNIQLNEINNTDSSHDKKKTTNILEKIEQSYFTCKKEKSQDNKIKIIKLNKTVTKNREKKKIMDNIWKIIGSQNLTNLKINIKNQK